MKTLITSKIKSVLVAMGCIAFSMGLFVLPQSNLTAQTTATENYNLSKVEGPCGEDGVDEIIHGNRKLFLGCWGSETTCKTKCK
ncbi:hypothetical protein [Gracilimonas amylolytica]|uniref:hypothetical protein n=1 Tax=Gracilimonas amylolytica TaxID=1749045 RepID=UPI0012FFE740|nr:hypothetical protein [Gracilimonas amylolytica]